MARFRGTMQTVVAMMITFALALAPQVGWAIGGSDDPPRQRPAAQALPVSDYERGRQAVEAGDYAGAIAHLERAVAVDPRHADVLNYLGYSTRKLGRFDESMIWYQRALAVDPRHRGALEYQGELFLALDNLRAAEANLARLAALCSFPCEERDELGAAIESYKKGRESRAAGR